MLDFLLENLGLILDFICTFFLGFVGYKVTKKSPEEKEEQQNLRELKKLEKLQKKIVKIVDKNNNIDDKEKMNNENE